MSSRPGSMPFWKLMTVGPSGLPVIRGSIALSSGASAGMASRRAVCEGGPAVLAFWVGGSRVVDFLMSSSPTIVWLRQDLRLADHPALLAAVASRSPIVPVFIRAPEEPGDWAPGAASRVFLHYALRSLDERLRERGLRLIVRQGRDALAVLRDLVRETKAGAVHWHRRYEPTAIDRDAKIKAALQREHIAARSFNGSLLYEPHEIATRNGDPYRVFTPYHKTTRKMPPPEGPQPAPGRDQLIAPGQWPASDDVDDLGLLPDHPWAAKVIDGWPVGEAAARDRMHRFARGGIHEYAEVRDRPDIDGTSRLSPHLHWGTVSPCQVWAAALKARREASDPGARAGCDAFLRELVWREFAYHVLYHFPHTPDEPLQPKYRDFPWVDMRQGRHWLDAWQRGRTGYPIVDAGMRQLWATGWMHNRVRMIVASFLTKDLRIHWLEGARWFWDTLIDADLANNTMGWQWAGGCGADAQPFFRIFNPVTQGRKFDPEGAYVRRWCPELADLPNDVIHEPWKAGMTLDYPDPIVDHAEARQRALDAFERIKGK